MSVKIDKNGIVVGTVTEIEGSNAAFYKDDKGAVNLNTYTESDGSVWVQVFHHNNPAANIFSTTNTFSTGCYVDANRWFSMHLCNSLTSWEFMIKQRATTTSTEEKYRWAQAYNPMSTSTTWDKVKPGTVTYLSGNGYTYTTTFGGIQYNGASNTYLCGANNVQGNWWGAIGACSKFNGGIPGWNGVAVTTGYLDVYVRIYNETSNGLSSFHKDRIKTNEIIEY